MMYCSVDEAYNNAQDDNIDLGGQIIMDEHCKVSNPNGFISAQGDMEDNKFMGTPLSKIKQDDDTFDDFSLETEVPKRNTTKYSHQYYIKQFLSGMQDDDFSCGKTQDPSIYDHVRTCKYCRVQIKKSLNSKTCDKAIIENFEGTTYFGYNFKELVIILVIGVIIIMILDLLVKIGRKV